MNSSIYCNFSFLFFFFLRNLSSAESIDLEKIDAEMESFKSNYHLDLHRHDAYNDEKHLGPLYLRGKLKTADIKHDRFLGLFGGSVIQGNFPYHHTNTEIANYGPSPITWYAHSLDIFTDYAY